MTRQSAIRPEGPSAGIRRTVVPATDGWRDADVWGGVLVTLLCVSAGAPVLLLQLAGDDPTIGPPWLWWAAFAVFLVTLIMCTWLMEVLRRPWLRVAVAGQVGSAAAVVLLAPRAGWTAILLVFTAALSAFVVSRRATGVIVALNSGVVWLASWLGHSGAMEAALSAFLYLVIQLVSVFAVVNQQQVEASRRELAEAHTELRATTALLADSSRATERLRIARDLHDLVGHQLTALALELEVASHHASAAAAGGASPAAEHVARARRIAKDLLGDVRETVGELRRTPPALREMLEAIVADLPRPEVHLRVADGIDLDEARTTALVRCVQEIVTNTIRHAGARHLWIDLDTAGDGEVVLTARDDGRGVAVLSLGNGLRGLRERVGQLGGSVDFATTRGFVVVARVPTA